MTHIAARLAVYQLVSFMAISYATTAQDTPLFRPDQVGEWYTFLSKSGKDNDPLKVFTFDKNILHVTGEDFGYISTKKKYSNFHLTLWFKWGEKKYPPREKEKRDAGILYLVDLYSGDKIWPRSIEFQIQEGDCGDFWMTDSTSILFNNKVTPRQNWHREVKFSDAEKPNGEWNKVEVIYQHDKITHLMNGQLVNEGSKPNIKQGSIVLQSEGAEIYYRDVVIQELK